MPDERAWAPAARALAQPVQIGSVHLRNGVMTASGTAGYGTELAWLLDHAALGAFVTKSLAAFEWAGNPAPRLHPTTAWMLNAVGLQGPGLAAWQRDARRALATQRQARHHDRDIASPHEGDRPIVSDLERLVRSAGSERARALGSEMQQLVDEEELRQARPSLIAPCAGGIHLACIIEQAAPTVEVDRPSVVGIYQAVIPELGALVGVGEARQRES